MLKVEAIVWNFLQFNTVASSRMFFPLMYLLVSLKFLSVNSTCQSKHSRALKTVFCVHVDGTKNNLDKYIHMRAADVSANIQDLVHGVFSNEYGVLVGETMMEWFFSQIHQ